MSDEPQTIAVVLAVDHELGIGKGGDLPWRLPNDLRHFRRVTMGHAIVMGRRTHEAMGRALDGRLNVVVTRQRDYAPAEGAVVVHSLDEALDAARGHNPTTMIIGGAGLLADALAGADLMHLTVVHDTFDADTFFPEFDMGDWAVVDVVHHPADAKNPHAHSFWTLRRDGDGPAAVRPIAGPGRLPDALRARR